mgnify:FL=1
MEESTNLNQQISNRIDFNLIKQGSVVVVGSENIANYLCAYLCGLGIGEIHLFNQDLVTAKSSSSEFLIAQSESYYERKIDKIENIVKQINKDVNITTFFSEFDSAFLDESSATDQTIIIDTTNNPLSKYNCYSQAKQISQISKQEVHLISASSNLDCASISKLLITQSQKKHSRNKLERLVQNTQNKKYVDKNMDNLLLEEYFGKKQGSYTSCVISALVADEIRKIVNPLFVESNKELLGRIDFSIYSDKLFKYSAHKSNQSIKSIKLNQSNQKMINLLNKKNKTEKKIHKKLKNNKLRKNKFKNNKFKNSKIKNKKILVVGVGGIGTYVALNCALFGYGQIDIYDGDIEEDHNLNRQILFYNSIGLNKADSIKQKLQKINSFTQINSYPTYFGKNELIRGKKYDLIFSCVDNWSARKLISEYSVKTKTPLINGSVTTFDCELDFFIPGKTLCHNCYNPYSEFIESEIENNGSEESASCADRPVNVVMPNAFVGGLMSGIGELVSTRNYKSLSAIINKKINYRSQKKDQYKFGFEKEERLCTSNCDCDCHKFA